MNTRKYDLTRGSILSKLMLIALPIMGSSLMQMLYNLTDMFWLGKLENNKVAVAASGSAGMFMWLSMAFLLLGRIGAEIGVSQKLGSGDKDGAKRFSQSALWIAITLGVGYAAVLIMFNGWLISFFNIKEAVVSKGAADYLAIVGIACPFTFISAVLLGTFNASGNSRIPFMINATGLLVNIVLDPILIFPANMGIIGAAVATAVAQLIVMLLAVAAVMRSGERPFEKYSFFKKPDFTAIRQIVRWSAPVAVESALFTLLAMLTTRFAAAFGSDAITVQRIGSQVESLTWLLGGGFATALTAFVGQNYGAKNIGRIKEGYRISTLTMIFWGGIVSVLFIFAGGQLFALFLSDAEIVNRGAKFLKILACCQIISCLEYVSAGAFRGMGKTLPPSIVSVISNIIRVPIAWFLSRTSLGLSGIWWGITIGAIIRGVWMYTWCFFFSKKLKHTHDGHMESTEHQLT